jgi:hypothetical protein
MAFELTQFRRRDRLATERELQYRADVGLDQGVIFFLVTLSPPSASRRNVAEATKCSRYKMLEGRDAL